MHEEAPEPGAAELAVQNLRPADDEDKQDTLLGTLRQRHSELAETKDVLIPLPGYDKEPPILMAKYRLLEGKEIDVIARKVQKETKDQWERGVLSAVDTFIAACEGMFIDLKNGQDPQLMTLNGVPVSGYNSDLARALEFPGDTARQVVFGVFTGNEVAIMQHNVRLSLWMGDTTRKMDEGFLGEM